MNDETTVGEGAAPAAAPILLCNWPGCTEHVNPIGWGCAPHWSRLPVDFRRQLISSRPGTEAFDRVNTNIRAWMTGKNL